MANDFNVTNCDPRLITVDDGMSLTRASVKTWTKQDVYDNFLKEVGLDKIIAQTKEARLAGVQEHGLDDLLLSRHVAIKEGRSSGSPSVIAPFSLVPRRNIVNPNYFRVSAGVVTGGGAPAAQWNITVTNGSADADGSPWVKSPNNALKNPEKYFLPGATAIIEYVNVNTNVAYTAVMRIISAVAGGDANTATVTVAPNKTYKGDNVFGGTLDGATNGWWETATGPQQAVYQPTTGVVQLGVNNVSDYQSYGYQTPGWIDLGLIEYWQQTYRWVNKYTDQYIAALNAATTSEGTKKFRTLPLAEWRRKQEMIQQKAFHNTVFYGDYLSEQQTTTNWQNLPVVQDPAWTGSGEAGSLSIEYQANTLGIRTQLNNCGMVLDNGGAPLNLDAIFEACYNIKRQREGASGNQVDRIDCFTDRFSKSLIRSQMLKYYKAKYSLDATAFIQPNQKLTYNGMVLFEYDIYDLPDQGVQLCVFTDYYFDDRVSQFQTAQRNRGRALWLIDWSDVLINIIKTNSVPRTNNLADNIYKYVMTPNVQHIMLNSKTFEVRIGNANRSRIIENFSDGCPKLTVPGCDLNG